MLYENNTIHFVLQSKGGCGKSFVSSLLSQFLKTKNVKLKLLDTDQENTTFTHFKGLKVKNINIMNAKREIDIRKFDGMIDEIVGHDGVCVVDNGSNTFTPWMNYAVSSDIFSVLAEQGKTVYVHIVVGGGDNLNDCTGGFVSITNALTGTPAKVVLWLNEHFGTTEAGGHKFYETSGFLEQQDKIERVIVLAEQNPMCKQDILQMNKARLTLDEVRMSPDFALVAKSRINRLMNEVFDQLDDK